MVLDVALPQAVRDHLAPILAAAPEAVRQTKEALRRWSHNATDDELARFDREAQSRLFEHPEKFARMDAFLAKRARPR
jgi:enoyl-CoA hydratase/carnithine racemase